MKKYLLALSSLLLTQTVFAQTQVITFNPPIPKKPVHKGACIGGSIAAPRYGAWMCAGGKHTFDPCFSQPNVPNAVVCDADPATNKPGFRLQLEQPLPFSQGLAALPGEAWKVQLANGVICTAATGPQMIIQDTGTIGFTCDETGLPAGVKAGLFKRFDLGETWMGHEVYYTVQNGVYTAQSIQQVQLQTVWQ